MGLINRLSLPFIAKPLATDQPTLQSGFFFFKVILQKDVTLRLEYSN